MLVLFLVRVLGPDRLTLQKIRFEPSEKLMVTVQADLFGVVKRGLKNLESFTLKSKIKIKVFPHFDFREFLNSKGY